ncbi:MAG: alpha/beta fold hydrolase [Acidimicrobiia bacterium]
MAIPEFRFVETSDGVRIAYQRFGTGAPTLVVGEVFNHLAVRWEFPLFRRAFDYLGDHLDVMLYDQRGCGMSDRSPDVMSVEDRMLDIDAILEAEGLDRVNLIAHGDGAIVAIAFAAAQPHGVDKLVISNGKVDVSTDVRAWELGTHPLGVSREEANAPGVGSWNWGADVSDFTGFTTPSLANDPTVTDFWLRFQRVTLSRDEMMRQASAIVDLDTKGAATVVQAPTLITHTTGNRAYHVGHARAWAELIPDATLVEVESDDHIIELTPSWREIYARHVGFISETAPEQTVRRTYAAVLFTDIVGSTSESLAEGDARWKEKLEAHDRNVEAVISECGGLVIKSTGDGILATFAMPSDAINAAVALRTRLLSFEVRIRAGIHAGEIETRDTDISGSVVNLAARTMDAAPAEQIFVTSSVRDQLLGSTYEFADAGSHELKGFTSRTLLFRIVG